MRTAVYRYMELTETGPIIDEAVAALGQRLRIAMRAHERTQHSALHRWFRNAVSNVAAEI